MRTILVSTLLACTALACSGSPSTSNPDACPQVAGTVTLHSLTYDASLTSRIGDVAMGSGACTGAPSFSGDTWTLYLDGHGAGSLTSATQSQSTSFATALARACTAKVVSSKSVHCASLEVSCLASANGGKGRDVGAVLSFTGSALTSTGVALEGEASCANLYDAAVSF